MPTLVTISTRIQDWQTLHHLHREELLKQAQELGATRYRVLRNAHDVAQFILLVELSTHEDAHELAQILRGHLQSTIAHELYREEIWESLGWEEIA